MEHRKRETSTEVQAVRDQVLLKFEAETTMLNIIDKDSNKNISFPEPYEVVAFGEFTTCVNLGDKVIIRPQSIKNYVNITSNKHSVREMVELLSVDKSDMNKLNARIEKVKIVEYVLVQEFDILGIRNE